MPKNKAHIRIPVSVFTHRSYLGLPEGRKGDCLAVLAALIRFTNAKSGTCYPRYAKLKEIVGYSESKLKVIINLMFKHRMINKKRLSSTNLYQINPELLSSDSLTSPVISNSDRLNQTGDSLSSPIRQSNLDSINKTNLIETSLIRTRYKNTIDSIVNNKNLNKENKIIKLATLPLRELKECISYHPYYVQKAIEHQEQELRAKKILPKHVVDQAITAAVSKTLKNRSAAYKAKVEYNKRNNLDWQGKPKK